MASTGRTIDRFIGRDFVAFRHPDALITRMDNATPIGRRANRSTAALLAASLLLVACGDSDPRPAIEALPSAVPPTTVVPAATVATTSATRPVPPSSVTSSPPTTTAAALPVGELTVAVREFWDLYLAVGSSPDPFDAEVARRRLAARSTGDSLNRLVATFTQNAANGVVVRGAIDVAPTVIAVDGATATVRDCHDDRTGLYRISDGVRLDADNSLRHRVLMTLVLDGGAWKVSAIRDEGDGCVVSR